MVSHVEHAPGLLVLGNVARAPEQARPIFDMHAGLRVMVINLGEYYGNVRMR
jgi:hypothetical protein